MSLRGWALLGGLLLWPVAGNSQYQVVVTPGGTQHQMAPVPAGVFLMGLDQSFPSADGGVVVDSVKEVFLPAFAIDRFEVTNAQYRVYVEATGAPLPRFWPSPTLAEGGEHNQPQQPVVGVSWFEAQAYCAWAGLRLPTEAEWEKAARGTDGRRYPWGDRFEPSRGHFSGTAAVAVGSYPAAVSPYGVLDLAGNASEWVVGEREGQERAGGVRGGSFATEEPAYYLSATPLFILPTSRAISVGFRCAGDAGGKGAPTGK
jgi:formylglycine-generating enzyme required for sulfatase activity